MKTNRFLTILLFILFSIIYGGLFLLLQDNYDRIMIGLCGIGNFLIVARSYRLENYLRQKDSMTPLGLIEHIGGLLNSRKKMIGLAAVIRPIINDDEFIIEKRIINRLTIILYIIIATLITVSIIMN